MRVLHRRRCIYRTFIDDLVRLLVFEMLVRFSRTAPSGQRLLEAPRGEHYATLVQQIPAEGIVKTEQA